MIAPYSIRSVNPSLEGPTFRVEETMVKLVYSTLHSKNCKIDILAKRIFFLAEQMGWSPKMGKSYFLRKGKKI